MFLRYVLIGCALGAPFACVAAEDDLAKQASGKTVSAHENVAMRAPKRAKLSGVFLSLQSGVNFSENQKIFDAAKLALSAAGVSSDVTLPFPLGVSLTCGGRLGSAVYLGVELGYAYLIGGGLQALDGQLRVQLNHHATLSLHLGFPIDAYGTMPYVVAGLIGKLGDALAPGAEAIMGGGGYQILIGTRTPFDHGFSFAIEGGVRRCTYKIGEIYGIDLPAQEGTEGVLNIKAGYGFG